MDRFLSVEGKRNPEKKKRAATGFTGSDMRILLAMLLVCVSANLHAAEVEGVKIPERLDAGGTALVLNGAGLRSRLIFNVYAVGLYLPSRQTAAQAAIAFEGPKRIVIHMLRTVGAKEFSEALIAGLEKNHDEAEFRGLALSVAQLNSIMTDLKEAREGMAIALDWAPMRGPQVLVNGTPSGAPIRDPVFMRGLLRVWLGDEPVQDGLKAALLGSKN